MTDIQEHDVKGREYKSIDKSVAEQCHIILPTDVNASFGLFGGRLMEWIDIVAAVVARRHSGRQVTTAAVDHLEFLAPAKLNDIVVLRGHMVCVGRTSMEICVETFVEELEGKGAVHLVNRAYLTMVALDNERKPATVPMLLLETEAQKADFALGTKRMSERKKRKANRTI